jgi:hypothetical protein
MKISDYPAAASITAADLVLVVQNGVTLQGTVQQVLDLAAALGLAVTSVNTLKGDVVITAAGVGAEAIGVAAAAIAAHNISATAHSSVAANYAAHLSADSHTQYHNNTRGDARYDPLGAASQVASARNARRFTVTDSPIAVTAPTLEVLLIDATGNVVVNLPTLTALLDGKRVTVKRMTGGADTLGINRGGADVIDGATTIALTAQYQVVHLIGCYHATTPYWAVL